MVKVRINWILMIAIPCTMMWAINHTTPITGTLLASTLPIRTGRQINSKWCRIKVDTKGLRQGRVRVKYSLTSTCNSNILKCTETIILTLIAFTILKINFKIKIRPDWDNKAFQIWPGKIAISSSLEQISTLITSHYLLIPGASTKREVLVEFLNRKLYQVCKGRRAFQWGYRSNNI